MTPADTERARALRNMDVIEIAAQALDCLKQTGLPYDEARVNPNGGTIAIVHPLGASGAGLTMTAIRQLERQGRTLRTGYAVNWSRPGIGRRLGTSGIAQSIAARA